MIADDPAAASLSGRGNPVNTMAMNSEFALAKRQTRCAPRQEDRCRRFGRRPADGRWRARAAVAASGLCCLLSACCCSAAEAVPAKQASGAEALLKTLDPFYKQHVTVDDLLIVSSEKVRKQALDEVAYLVRKMLANRPDVLKTLAEKKAYVGVMAYNEMTTDIPECRGMGPWWDKRARGLGGNPVTCAEENILSFRGDPYQGENIFIHEFGHIIHRTLAQMDEAFNTRLKTLYQQAKQSGRFRAYGMSNHGEFWAEGVQSWFNCNRRGGLEVLGADGKHLCHINTREQMKTHMPAFAKLLDEAFRQNRWVYVPVQKRLDQPHLRGYDPAKAPAFRWPPKVIEAVKRIEAEKARKRKQKK